MDVHLAAKSLHILRLGAPAPTRCRNEPGRRETHGALLPGIFLSDATPTAPRLRSRCLASSRPSYAIAIPELELARAVAFDDVPPMPTVTERHCARSALPVQTLVLDSRPRQAAPWSVQPHARRITPSRRAEMVDYIVAGRHDTLRTVLGRYTKAERNCRNTRGQNLLHIACRMAACAEVLTALCELGVRRDVRDYSDRIPLQWLVLNEDALSAQLYVLQGVPLAMESWAPEERRGLHRLMFEVIE